MQQRDVVAGLVQRGDEPVIQFKLLPDRTALDVVLLRMVLQKGASPVERLANPPPASQVPVEFAEQRPRCMDEYLVRHRQHRRNPR